MTDNQETAQYTWARLAKFFNFSLSKAKGLRVELEAAGAIFHTKIGCPGKQVIGFFPSIIKAWVIQKSAKGERV